MKNKIFIIISVLALIGLSSCELDYYPGGLIEQEQAFQTIRDAESLRNHVYVGLRNSFNGAYYHATDKQADLVNATLSFGNRDGFLYTWNLYSNDYTVGGIWENIYARLANINNFLDNIDKIVPGNETERTRLALYKSEVHLARAILYRSLILRYAKDYEPATAATDLGVPLVLTYDVLARPARATVQQVYDQILTDIAAAKVGLTTPGAPVGGPTTDAQKLFRRYLSVDCITALEAQVYLEMHRYTEAAAAADQLISSGRYPLISTTAALTTMWTDDDGPEIIFQPLYANQSEAANGVTGYISYNGTIYQPDYVPQQWVVDLFAVGDIRRGVFIKQYNINISGVNYNNVWLVNKYPGKSGLFTGTSNYVHSPKIFRIAEMHLIKAEALAWSNQDGQALDALNVLRQSRGLAALSGITGADLKEEILTERTRELFCEGTRLYDLKRFKLPVVRRTPQNINFVVTAPAGTTIDLRKEVGDNLFVWGIPRNDMQTNPNLVQNPGW